MKILCMVLIGTGTLMMIQKRKQGVEKTGSRRWLGAALLSAAFASLTAILGKIGIQGVESNLGTAIRTCVVLAMAWLLVFLQGKQKHLGKIAPKSWFFLIISGLQRELPGCVITGPCRTGLPVSWFPLISSVFW